MRICQGGIAKFMSNVYADLAAMMGGGQRGPAALGGWLHGTVEAAGQGELLVTCDGLRLGPEDIAVCAPYDYAWESDTGEMQLLRPGDRVIVLVTADRQDYLLWGKAVI